MPLYAALHLDLYCLAKYLWTNKGLTFRPNKKVTVFRVTGLKNLGTHFFPFFLKNDNLMHFERQYALQNA